MSASRAKLTGARGEQAAAEFLRKKGYEIVGLNYRVRGGEIDVIAKNRRYLVFAEVKTRASGSFALAREYVTAAKQRRLVFAAGLYLAANPTKLQPRFDVIEIYTDSGDISHIENAFDAD